MRRSRMHARRRASAGVSRARAPVRGSGSGGGWADALTALRGRRPGWFALALGSIAALGGVIRVLWIENAAFRPGGLIVDEQYYHRVANFVAHGLGYISPYAFDAGSRQPAGARPPLYSLVLALESKLGLASFHSHRLLGAL